ncbi:hypothetical protein C8R43DRAFT_1074753 [Mycena crocata]|nr:hypothetical protein C8R43DRAFT_1074753 [Mycena crocata]
MPAIRNSPAKGRARRRRASPSSAFSDAVTTSSGSGPSPRRSNRFTRDASSDLSSLSPSPEPQIIVIRGQQLHPTPVFYTLWWWITERQRVYDKRCAGMPAPWTLDPILQKNQFCNSYRVLDRTSQFVITDVIEKGSQDPTELLFRILLFNCFNRIEAWKVLEEAFDVLTWEKFDLAAYGEVLSAAQDRKVSLFTNAYMKIAAKKLDYAENHMRHLQILEILMVDLPDILANAKYAVEVFEKIAAYPGMGGFTGFQLTLALSYSKLLNFSANDFVVAGPGASSGLVKMFGASIRHAKEAVRGIEADVLRWMVTTQREQFARLGLVFPYLRSADGKELELELPDLEHAVCEVDKYAREGHPKIQGTSGRTHLRRSFNSVAPRTKLPAVPSLPVAWADPARQVSRIRPGPVVVDKRYVVLAIVDQREAPPERKKKHGDSVEYLIDWHKYPACDRTWEPRCQIIEDAPLAVAEFKTKQAKAKKMQLLEFEAKQTPCKAKEAQFESKEVELESKKADSSRRR